MAAACAPVITTTDGQRLRVTDQEFRDYAESVFRRQNAAIVALADRLELTTDPSKMSRLQRAEGVMLRACGPLNTVAAARRDGEALARDALRGAAVSVPDCDLATRDVEALTADVPPRRQP